MAMQLPEYTLKVNPWEAGVLMGLIETAEERVKPAMQGVRSQLILLKKNIEKAEGITKRLLPDGRLEITDKDGNKIIRPPYSWEIEDN